MSVKQPSITFNSAVSETYKIRAEAFAKCLQDKFLSLRGVTDFVEYINFVREKLDDGSETGQLISARWKDENGEHEEEVLRMLGNNTSNVEGCTEEGYGSMTEKSSWSLCVDIWKYMERNDNGLFWSIPFNENLSSFDNLKPEKEQLVLLCGMENYGVTCTVPRKSFSANSPEKYFRDADNRLCDKGRLPISCDLQNERLNKDKYNDSLNVTMKWIAYGDEMKNVVRFARESTTTIADAILNHMDEACQAPLSNDRSIIRSTTSSEDLEDDFPLKLRRYSSLKTWNSPPETPGAKKIVRFADTLGLDLTDIRTFLDEIPKVPSSAYVDLECGPDSITVRPINLTLVPRFHQPISRVDFVDRVRSECVCLESATLIDNTVLAVSGCIRVLNLDYEKAVFVRYSSNNWQNYSDLRTTYVSNSSDSFSDKFSFILYGRSLNIGQKLEFAVRFECRGTQFWDNNRGENYTFECLAQSPSTSLFTEAPLSPTDAWSIFY